MIAPPAVYWWDGAGGLRATVGGRQSLGLFPSGTRPPVGTVCPAVKTEFTPAPLAHLRVKSFELSASESWCVTVASKCRVTLVRNSEHLSPGDFSCLLSRFCIPGLF